MGTLCYPPSSALLLPCVFTRGGLFGKEECDPGGLSQEGQGQWGLGIPQTLSCADGLSPQPDWVLDPWPTLCCELKKIVVQFECVLVCLPSIGACAPSESGTEFLGHPLHWPISGWLTSSAQLVLISLPVVVREHWDGPLHAAGNGGGPFLFQSTLRDTQLVSQISLFSLFPGRLRNQLCGFIPTHCFLLHQQVRPLLLLWFPSPEWCAI